MPKLETVTVTFEHKSYTWDGRRWYGTDDYMMPTFGMIRKLVQLLPKVPAEVKPPVALVKPARAKRPATPRA